MLRRDLLKYALSASAICLTNPLSLFAKSTKSDSRIFYATVPCKINDTKWYLKEILKWAKHGKGNCFVLTDENIQHISHEISKTLSGDNIKSIRITFDIADLNDRGFVEIVLDDNRIIRILKNAESPNVVKNFQLDDVFIGLDTDSLSINRYNTIMTRLYYSYKNKLNINFPTYPFGER